MKLKFIDLFAGIGGFRLGMTRAGHIPVGWCEIDKFAQKSYKAMYDTEGEWFSNDIRTVEPRDLPKFDCITGGFPCQSFSIAGKRAGFEDTKIRKLTPRECWRLQGFPDELFEKAREVNSDSQLYKQAGNAVTVNVIEEIAKKFNKNLGGM